ncbi:DUF948 domain-containing protein [Paenibacillus xerothermodurans]|uniref:DUF948 domain-containing protein n=1 Tax=Paenibacillus xerothermodurans TaxID=1977292 RepID=A0A2W1NBE7_PAEXE|nr:DUF948 domain-containing protein [Paenibacillus xerothermodurans]PZE21010.1 DUF948 domain-containing protein [Paenibacillus xerothermodurans]
MFWQIGICAACLAIIILIAVVIPAVLAARHAVQETVKTLQHMQMKVEQTAEESRQLAVITQQLLGDVQNRIQRTEAFFQAMDQTGEAAGRFSKSVELVSHTLTDTVLGARNSLHSRQETIREIIDLTTTGMQLWHRWQAQKSSKAAAKDE